MSVNRAYISISVSIKSFLVSGIHRPALSESVTLKHGDVGERNYPCLYDKRSADFRDKNKKSLTWSDVSQF